MHGKDTPGRIELHVRSWPAREAAAGFNGAIAN
jgi:hypothetical protein